MYLLCRYFFKKASDEFDSGVVLEEVTEDSDILPLWDGKIIAKVERKLWSSGCRSVCFSWCYCSWHYFCRTFDTAIVFFYILVITNSHFTEDFVNTMVLDSRVTVFLCGA